MATQTMGSQGGYGSGSGGNASRRAEEPRTDLLGRQSSMYNLTLDEVQDQLGDLGKPLSSMNLDELLKSVWSAEANQGLGGVDFGDAQPGNVASSSSLLRQSSVSLAKGLSKKTVDEVWQDIQEGQKKSRLDRKMRERKSTLGEMTLEDFLVKAGIVAEGEKNPGAVPVVDAIEIPQQSAPQQAQWMPYQTPPVHQLAPPQQQQNMFSVFMPGPPLPQTLPVTANPMMDGYADAMSPSALMDNVSDTQAPGRKRNASGVVVEKTVERRQKRMIKNRESAARSRARKQAYTQELELKVSRLEEENERLRNRQEAEKELPNVLPPEPKYQLRRTSSAHF
ncbi:ABSCISIC ACID-INSENSITIVE 5-like protein 2 [Daucus carota subsp. sativus]|nr:PREDICTED: ABSCISIC ACID-INSENSITIVE 5-like protein 2 [Daucus carota subsp. sativus]XP_017246933.1 PREDICTED: ABSCISIC ACID-INSENSITIVE 5-like protein 2 [Daucus carota subsp. sativus]XP_017246934.1 PREDICTED: ABSCISIC ACID-INSENSITIVE 5-like protein 2 [Daucus carota subsp. sativus]